MSMSAHFYVGPYMITKNSIEDDGDFISWENILCNFPGDYKRSGDPSTLVPNCKMPSINRNLIFSEDGPQIVTSITQNDIKYEMDAFCELTKEFRSFYRNKGYSFEVLWGVVPGYF